MDIAALWLGWVLVWAFGVAVHRRAAQAHLRHRRHRRDRVRDRRLRMVSSGNSCSPSGCALLSLARHSLRRRRDRRAARRCGALRPCSRLAGLRVRRTRSGARSRPARNFAAPASQRLAAHSGSRSSAWLALRFVLLLVEATLRPLYPWDAWTQWATKARVWYALKSMAPFVGASEWLAAPTGSLYFDAAPHYPATVPLTQVWSAIAPRPLGRRADQSAVVADGRGVRHRDLRLPSLAARCRRSVARSARG